MTPRATYRLQFNKHFTFADATAIIPYLAALGVSHVYASPILAARAGSTHGYDVVDPCRINPELGGETGVREFVAALHAKDMGLIVDIVPNHMGVGGGDNLWWLDVLRNGVNSPYAPFFDIDWTPLNRALTGKVLAPFLGEPYGTCLEKGDLQLRKDERHGWAVFYHQHVFPIRTVDAEKFDEDPDAALAQHDPATPEGRDNLHSLLERQYYRLAWFRTAGDMINWRRFFDVTELATLQAERWDVFQQSHELILNLYAEGLIDGLRIDHIDGLADPAGYCQRLRAALAERQDQRPASQRQRAWVVVEKILAPDEELDPSWDMDGTTGYDFMNEVSLLLHDAAGSQALCRDWAARTGRPAQFARQEYAARREIVVRAFSAQLDSAVDALGRIADLTTNDRDLSRAALRRCLVEILGCFPRYRSYAAQTDENPDAAAPLREAIDAARPLCFPSDREHLDRIFDWLGSFRKDMPNATLRRLAIRRFEQLSAPVAAKAVEDTAFYRHGPILSRTDVGFDPGRGGFSVRAWHERCLRRVQSTPFALLATATHDHKRGEDVRARLAVLSEQPQAWTTKLSEWMTALGEITAEDASIDPADLIMMLQTVVGIWPEELQPDDHRACEDFAERIRTWQLKALREAKLQTSWEAPDEAYEAAVLDLTSQLLLGSTLSATRSSIFRFVKSLLPAARDKTLAQTVLKLCVPGVPDIYQGAEFLDLSLVDPDNRRPVDYAARATALTSPPADLNATKQHVVARLLQLRQRQPDVFCFGDYRPLTLAGPHAEDIVAFSRSHEGCHIVVIARITNRNSTADDRDPGASVELPVAGEWDNILQSGIAYLTRSTDLASLLGDACVAVYAIRD
ncbi:malto-oligosyltrehalose synthase [Roseiarcaceae bacterium H3SJ34-1]|uniref:malto-oligosyltrehalose synthase n=1 Tax=Terripilifer ovatus TaxID=3032367 RepID=UPI003AB9AD3E|nr:malto-oligosyltrehalose synthase [Roseiarcaceae bacterium H3SJ34-1]